MKIYPFFSSWSILHDARITQTKRAQTFVKGVWTREAGWKRHKHWKNPLDFFNL